ncbi:MAG: AAA family ATPase [Myxococcota bacterium]
MGKRIFLVWVCTVLLGFGACACAWAHWLMRRIDPTEFSGAYPFLPAPPVQRDVPLQQLLAALQSPDSKIVLVGARGIGKTMLLRALSNYNHTKTLDNRTVVLIHTDRLIHRARGGNEEQYTELLRRAMDHWVKRLGPRVVFAIDDAHYALSSKQEQHPFLQTLLQAPYPVVLAVTDEAYGAVIRSHIDQAAPEGPRQVVLRHPSHGELRRMVVLAARYLDRQYRVTITGEAIDHVVFLAVHALDERLAESTLRLLHEAYRRVAERGGATVGTEDIVLTVTRLALSDTKTRSSVLPRRMTPFTSPQRYESFVRYLDAVSQLRMRGETAPSDVPTLRRFLKKPNQYIKRIGREI